MEYIDVLNEKGNITGEKKLKAQIHRDGDWHRSVHVWILNSQGKLLIQKRSPEKDSYPNMWDISFAGHVSSGDDSVITVKREAEEELGISVSDEDFIFLGELTQQSVLNNGEYLNNEFNDVYLIKKDFDISNFVKQPEEVSEVKWINWRELKRLVENNEGGGGAAR